MIPVDILANKLSVQYYGRRTECEPEEYSCGDAYLEENWFTISSGIVKIQTELVKEVTRRKAHERRIVSS